MHSTVDYLSVEELSIGFQLAPMRKARLTSSHVARWIAAQQNWDKIHYDLDFARDVAHLPGTVINGALKQHFIAQFLHQRFGALGWVWRIDYQFIDADRIGSILQVQGKVVDLKFEGNFVFAHVDVEILNIECEQVTTRGTGVVVLNRSGRPVLDGFEFEHPKGFELSRDVAPSDTDVSEEIRRRLGVVIESRESYCEIDLSRLRLFADAIMGMPPMFYDPAASIFRSCSAVVAPPLFPLHGIEAAPDSLPLSEDITAFGREGASEVGRNLSSLFGFESSGMLNGGNKVEIHSFARCGERICGNSILVDVRRRTGRRAGEMLLFETLNSYWESEGRPLVTERQIIIARLNLAQGAAKSDAKN